MNRNNRPQPPVIITLNKCPWCKSPWTYAYKTEGPIQRRACRSCGLTFKATLEQPDRPRPDKTPATTTPRKKGRKKTTESHHRGRHGQR